MRNLKFIHLADLHLGKRQYNLNIRYLDYFKSFNWVLERAIKEEIDFLLISGDIFDSKNINPSVLSDVYHSIIKFKQESLNVLGNEIPIICIEGNHDNPIYTPNSWMRFLADLELIILLAGEYDKEKRELKFESYSKLTKRGGKIEIKDAIIYGIPYFGSFTTHIFPIINDAVLENQSRFIIMLMHFGIEGEDRLKPGIELSPTLLKLNQKIDYLALGHFHKQYSVPEEDPWIFNPGSLEMNDLRELQYQRGAFLVEISGKEYYNKEISFIECDSGKRDPNKIPNREFIQISPEDISGTKSFDDAVTKILKKIKKWGIHPKIEGEKVDINDLNLPILSLDIFGEIQFSKLEIDINKLREEIKSNFKVLDVRISAKNLFSTLDDLNFEESDLTIEEIEKKVFGSLIKINPEYGKYKDQILNFLFDVKSELLQRKPNFSKLKDQFAEWCKLNVDNFNPLKSDIEKINQSDLEVTPELIEKKTIDAKQSKKNLISNHRSSDNDEDSDFGFYDEFDDLDRSIDDGEDLNGEV